MGLGFPIYNNEFIEIETNFTEYTELVHYPESANTCTLRSQQNSPYEDYNWSQNLALLQKIILQEAV